MPPELIKDLFESRTTPELGWPQGKPLPDVNQFVDRSIVNEVLKEMGGSRGKNNEVQKLGLMPRPNTTLGSFVAGTNEASLRIFALKDRSMNKKKKCRRCSRTKVIAEFIEVIRGARNPRGHYCAPCHLEEEKEWHERAR